MVKVVASAPAEFSDIPAFLASRFFNIRMLWHNIMDFLLPIYWTMTSYYSGVIDNHWGQPDNSGYGVAINRSNEVLLFDTDGTVSLFYLKALTDNPITLLDGPWPEMCYRTMILGLRKLETHPQMRRGSRNNLQLPYQIDPAGVRGLRKTMLEFAGTSLEKCEPDREHPIVLIVHRKTTREVRRLLNPEEFANATREMCPYCNVQMVDFQQFDKNGQIRFICNASVLIGIHGSGLIHAIWMKESTPQMPAAVFELFPFKYTCRDWYGQCARIAKLQYFPIYTLNINQTRWEDWHNMTKVNRCHTLEGECNRGRCHDFLRDQSILVDIPYYKSIATPFFSQMNKSREWMV
jgi:hypothetical protein